MAELLRLSENEGYTHVHRLIKDWESGENRFAQNGEQLVVALDTKVIGVCGLNDNGDGRGRLRRLYVHPDYRGSGIGRKLVDLCVDHGLRYGFENIVVHAGSESAIQFYDHLEWWRIDEERLTHIAI